ncbi:MAG: phenylalanine--tRNA ligase subunit alpha [Puniceicoccales bacterium]|jgi:phenylalanyl-tRNA synthetase alpha chain|nr:phenylalanine--tRNA ligase subunit alpha [Puniceicoccales bacterium]
MSDEHERRKALIDHLFAQAERNRRAGQVGEGEVPAQAPSSFAESPSEASSPEGLEERLRSRLRQLGTDEGLRQSLAEVSASLAPGSPLQRLIAQYLQEHPMEELIDQARQELATVHRRPDWESCKARFLGPQGPVRALVKNIQSQAPEQRPAFGQRINALKTALEELFDHRRQELEREARRRQLPPPIDLTLRPRLAANGTLHPLTRLRRRIDAIFQRLGYSLAEGSEIETEWFCFDALNTPPEHPARDEQDTFYLPRDLEVGNVPRRREGDKTERHILRSQTSTVQIRTMLAEKPPLRIVSPGRVFRRDANDATHSANFHQYEGLYVDRKVTVADLRNTLFFFLQELLGTQVQMRLRPSFFPFTEPSFELDVCSPSLGKLSGQWVEIIGCGLVDPEVFRAVDYDPEQWTGFAFALGLERIAMFLYGIDDIRHFTRNDWRFLRQFA